MLACAIIFIDSFFVLFQFVEVTLIMTKISKNDSGSKASCIRDRMINAGVSSFCAFVLILILLCESFFLFRSKLLIILLLFLQSFCFIVNRLTSEPFFSLSHDASFLRHFSGRVFLAGFVFSCWFYLCLYFEILFVLLRDGRGWFELSF